MNRPVPWWGLASATAAPVLLVGGWTLAASLQGNGFDPVTGTISALAALDADHRWVMTAALVGTGLCHPVTALALRDASTAGRLWHAAGGLATVGVALFPVPGGGGESDAPLHVVTAAAAFGLLGSWPLVERLARRRRDVPWGLGGLAVAGASVLLLGTLGWFVAELSSDGDRVGLAERTAAASQAVWPLVVVSSTRLSRPRGRRPARRP